MIQQVNRIIKNLQEGGTITFVHQNDSTLKYGVTKTSDSVCLLFWTENDSFDSTSYPSKLVEKFFTEGTWIEI